MAKAIDDLEFTDDYMFGEVLKNKEICIGVLERLLGIKIKDIEYPEIQKSIKAGYDIRGIRLDVYAADNEHVYDIEMQNSSYAFLGKRTRFYQSMIDTDHLLRGKDYSELKESYVIFICKKDLFKQNFPRYTFQNICLEDYSVNLNDFSSKVIYNASAYESCTDKELKNFLKFICTNESTDDFSQQIKDCVTNIKKNEVFRKEYLTMTIHEQDIAYEARKKGHEEGKLEGKLEGRQEAQIETAKNFLKMGLSVEQISEGTGLSLEEVENLQ